jgi:hypothetical protein
MAFSPSTLWRALMIGLALIWRRDIKALRCNLLRGKGLCLVALIWATVAGIHFLAVAINPKPIQFRTLREFMEFAKAKQLVLVPPTGVNSTFISDHPPSAEQLREITMLNKNKCGLTPAWRGIVWACQIDSKRLHLNTETISGNRRYWGNLLVAGDEEMMERIERLYHGD